MLGTQTAVSLLFIQLSDGAIDSLASGCLLLVKAPFSEWHLKGFPKFDFCLLSALMAKRNGSVTRMYISTSKINWLNFTSNTWNFVHQIHDYFHILYHLISAIDSFVLCDFFFWKVRFRLFFSMVSSGFSKILVFWFFEIFFFEIIPKIEVFHYSFFDTSMLPFIIGARSNIRPFATQTKRYSPLWSTNYII